MGVSVFAGGGWSCAATSARRAPPAFPGRKGGGKLPGTDNSSPSRPEGEALARIGPRLEVRAWLKEWTGVSVYRDGFRVWPYGEPHDDWLRLDQRRVNNPVEHLSNNQILGFIEISRDGNPDLLDQTNREGLFHNQAVEDLRRLVYFVLQVLEAA